MDLISVIVPIYDTAPYLDRCIQSITAQTYPNIEIILVNDGSTDRGGEICDQWAHRDGRIRVIHQGNSGAGSARNAALDIAHGTMIGFVDSDDYIAPDMYAHLLSLMTPDTGIAECGYKSISEDEEIHWGTGSQVTYFAPCAAMEAHIQDRCFRQLIWNKLFRREVIGTIRFPVGKRIDDEFFTYQILVNAKGLVRSERICYAYRQHGASVMHTVTPQMYLEAAEARLQRHEYILKSFPMLEPISLKSLWFTSIYQAQRALRELPLEDALPIVADLQKLANQYSVQFIPSSMKDSLWLLLAKLSFPGVCKLRNAFKIGL